MDVDDNTNGDAQATIRTLRRLLAKEYKDRACESAMCAVYKELVANQVKTIELCDQTIARRDKEIAELKMKAAEHLKRKR
jgi:hypothetical protein